MGEVFLAHDERLDRRVAIKCLYGGTCATEEQRLRFQREARIAARVDHPAIVRVYDVGRAERGDYIVIDYVDGIDLRQHCAARPVSIEEVVAIALQVARGMTVLREHDIVHRDLKSENILITRTGQVKIADFGIARLQTEGSMTPDGNVLGTYRCMAPELVTGRGFDHRADMFSFGVLLYELLTRKSPFLAQTTYETMEQILWKPPQVPLAELCDPPERLLLLVSHLLNKTPELRPRDFHYVVDVLEVIAECDLGGIPLVTLAHEVTADSLYDGGTFSRDDPQNVRSLRKAFHLRSWSHRYCHRHRCRARNPSIGSTCRFCPWVCCY